MNAIQVGETLKDAIEMQAHEIALLRLELKRALERAVKAEERVTVLEELNEDLNDELDELTLEEDEDEP